MVEPINDGAVPVPLPRAPQPLSARELQVLAMTSQGLTNLQTAQHLGVTVHAVKFHLASIYKKLGVANRTEAAVAYLRRTAPAPENGG